MTSKEKTEGSPYTVRFSSKLKSWLKEKAKRHKVTEGAIIRTILLTVKEWEEGKGFEKKYFRKGNRKGEKN